jgi:heat shock protein HspQ
MFIRHPVAAPTPNTPLSSCPSRREPSGKAAMQTARFFIGQVVRHRLFPFRGVIFDVDPEFDNTEEWYQAIPEEVRPRKNQPFYHLFAENAETEYVAYVSEQNLVPDETGDPVRHPQVAEVFDGQVDGAYRIRGNHRN